MAKLKRVFSFEGWSARRATWLRRGRNPGVGRRACRAGLGRWHTRLLRSGSTEELSTGNCKGSFLRRDRIAGVTGWDGPLRREDEPETGQAAALRNGANSGITNLPASTRAGSHDIVPHEHWPKDIMGHNEQGSARTHGRRISRSRRNEAFYGIEAGRVLCCLCCCFRF